MPEMTKHCPECGCELEDHGRQQEEISEGRWIEYTLIVCSNHRRCEFFWRKGARDVVSVQAVAAARKAVRHGR